MEDRKRVAVERRGNQRPRLMDDREFLKQVDYWTSPDVKRGPAYDEWIEMRKELARRLNVEVDEYGFFTEEIE